MPDKDISLIPTEYGKGKGISQALFSKWGILGIVLVVLSLAVYGGLVFYNKSLKQDLIPLKDRVEELNQQRDKQFEERVKTLDNSLKDLKIILENHIYWSNLFSIISQLTVPQVSFSTLNSNTKSKDNYVSISVAGKTTGYTYLAKQIRSFEQSQLISNVKVGGISLGTAGGIEFLMTINFKEDILTQNE